MKTNPGRVTLWRSLRSGTFVLAAVIVVAFGVQVTQVDFAELQSAQRMESLTRVLRALADPDVVYYVEEEQKASTVVQVPCRPGTPPPEQPGVQAEAPYIVMLDPCVTQRENGRVEGFHFAPNQEGFLRLTPSGAPGRLIGVIFSTDAQGHFLTEFRMPAIDDQTVPVTIEVTVRRPVGLLLLTDNALLTFDKIVETIFIALIATLLSAIVAVPLSFLAARNIMEPVTMPFGSLLAAVLAAPIGAYLAGQAFGWLNTLGGGWAADPVTGLVALAGCVGALVATGYLSGLVQPGDAAPTLIERVRRTAGGLTILALLGLTLAVLAGLIDHVGLTLEAQLPAPLVFLGNFLAVLAETVSVILPLVGAIIGLLILLSFGQNTMARILRRVNPLVGRGLTVAVGAAAGAVWTGLFFSAIAWLRVIEDPLFVQMPAALVGGLVALLALFVPPLRTVRVGNGIYYLMRTIFNVVRAVEALILVLVFVIWVGIGPFAGTLALALHNIVVFGKLYSEQVENILPGPLEAITATGATRLQTIVYAVIPQIVAPFIALTLYRWDVNVRSSTILGFAGGGGIGFILQQNINLLKYRSASTQMLAIAIVVIILDYASARIREKYT